MGRGITEGEKFQTDKWKIEEAEIREFAAKYDPQPIHLDNEFAANGLFGRIIASGFMTISIAWSLWVKSGIPGSDQRAGISMDKVRWLRPVFVDDELYAIIEVLRLRKTSKPNLSIAILFFSVKNQKEELVLEFEATGLMEV